MTRFAKRLRALFRRRQLDRDLADEMRFHLEMKAQETGAPADATRAFGNLPAIQEACRDLWTFTTLETLWWDLRYGLRTLARSPGFVLVVALVLALGIGANTTVFTVVGKALSFDLGVERPDRIVFITTSRGPRDFQFLHSLPDMRDLLSQIRTVTNLAAYRFLPANVSDTTALPERYFGAQLTANGFAIIHRRPVLGRAFGPDDMRPGAAPVLLLGHRLWTARYGQDPSVIGRTIRVNDVLTTIVGVMPAGMQFPEDVDFWQPLIPSALAASQPPNLLIFGRLADGISLQAARTEIDAIAHRLAGQSPDKFKGLIADVQPILAMYGVYDSKPMFIALLLAVGFVLLMACANVANILLARGSARTREISVRIAIGAGRARILRQLLIESVTLSVLGGFLGWLVALGGLHWFDTLTARTGRPSWVDFSMHTGAFLYLAAISVGAGLLFGLAPALQLAKVDVIGAVKSGGHAAAGGIRGRRLSGLLVVFEMALAVVLLAGAGLMIRSTVNLYNSPLGVNTAGVLTMRVNLSETKYPHAQDRIEFHRALKTKLAALPGVEATALASNLPGAGWIDLPFGDGLVVSPDYFRVMQIVPKQGRLFAEHDADVAVVNESFAAKFWPGESPLGKRIEPTSTQHPGPSTEVVGVIPDIPQDFRRPTRRDPLIYLPYSAMPDPQMFIVARTAVPPATLAEAFRRQIQSLDENLPAYEVQTLDERIARNRLGVTAFGTLFTVFAIIALLLAAIGLYGVTAHSVSLRTQEIGIRVAVGGQRRDILALVFRQAARQLALGLLAGIPVALFVSRLLSRSLVDVSAADPVAFLAAAAVLIAAGLIGCIVPARRAVRVDPLEALRAD